MPYQPIECRLYDYIEIACMRHYDLQIKLLSGENIIGQAQTTRVAQKEEFLLIKVNSTIQEIRLDKISTLKALNNGAEFGKVTIASLPE